MAPQPLHRAHRSGVARRILLEAKVCRRTSLEQVSRRVPQPHQLDSVDVINVGSAINEDGTVGDSDCGVRLAAVLDEASSALL